jgi:uncharacterized protein YnzC (UPF0291/DUF896 family)
MDNLLKIKNVKSLTVDDLSKNYKIEYISKFQNAFKEDLLNLTKIDPKDKSKKVRKTQQELCNEIGISVTTLKRYMKDLGMKSFYRHTTEHTKNVKTKNTKKETEEEQTIEVSVKKKKSKPKKLKNNDTSNMEDKYEMMNNNL